MSYRIEISPNNRAGCQAKRCKDETVKILKGELRQAVMVTIRDHQSWVFRHWGCVTPTILHNWWDTAEQNLEMIDGFDVLPEDAQAKVQQALEQGHVDDDEWKGDEGLNRYNEKNPKQGMYARVSKKRAADDEDDDNDEKPKSAKKVKGSDTDENEPAVPKKKGKKAKSDAAAEDASAAPAKKAKKGVKDDPEDEKPAPKKRQTKAKAAEPEAEDVDSAPAKKSRSKKPKADADVPAEPVKKARGKKVEAEPEEEAELKAAPKRKGRKAAS